MAPASSPFSVCLHMVKVSKIEIENSSVPPWWKNEVGENELQGFGFSGCSIENLSGKRQFWQWKTYSFGNICWFPCATYMLELYKLIKSIFWK